MGKSKRNLPQSEPLTNFLAPLEALQNLIAEFKDQGVIIGGVAASLLGTPRFTVDIDAVFLLNIEDISSLLEQASKLGINPRISDPEGFAHKTRVLLLSHSASGTNIDIQLGILPFEYEMVERSRMVDIGQIKVRLPTPEDLIIMKAIAYRSKDIEDIQTIAVSNPILDKEYLRLWLNRFGEALDLPNLWNEIHRLILKS